MDRPIIYIGDNTILTKLIYGPTIYLDPRDPVQAHMVLSGFWEKWITDHFLKAVKPGMKVLDIGAHCGYYTLLASMLAGAKGEVHAFEPNPSHLTNLRRSLIMNGYYNTKIHQIGLSNKNEEVTLYIPEAGGASIVNPGSEHQQEVKIKTVILSEYLPPQKIDVLKIDIDGSEPLIMDDIFKIINQSGNMQIFLEYSPQAWIGYNPSAIFRRFIELGFKLYKIVPHTGNLVPITVAEVASLSDLYHIDLKMERDLS